MNTWATAPLGDLCGLVNGRAFRPTDWTKTGLPIVRIQNLNDSTKPFNRYSYPVSPKHQIDTGDILLSWSGTPSFGCFVTRIEPAHIGCLRKICSKSRSGDSEPAHIPCSGEHRTYARKILCVCSKFTSRRDDSPRAWWGRPKAHYEAQAGNDRATGPADQGTASSYHDSRCKYGTHRRNSHAQCPRSARDECPAAFVAFGCLHKTERCLLE